MPRCAPLQPYLNVFLDISYDKLGHISSFPCDIMISSLVGTEQHSVPVESSDMVVITKAQEIDAILLSLNGDFSHIVNYPPKDYKGIVALQMHNHAETLPKLVARLTAYLKEHTMMDHYRGKLLVVEVDRIRIRE
jgi:hypothetical protein